MTYVLPLYRWALLLPAVLPLFFIEGTMYPLLAPKTLALRAFGVIAVALFSYLALSGHSFFWARLHRKETWIPAALLVLAYLASLFGSGFYHSFWSTFERGDGLLTLSVCVGYFYLILLSVDAFWIKRFFQAVAWTGTLAALYLVIQWIAVSSGADVPFIVKPNGRIGGTMGNAAFLAAYLGIAAFVTLAAARSLERPWRCFLRIGVALQIFAILLTATRGTILALIATAFMVVTYFALRGEGKRRAWAAGLLATLLIAAGAFVAFRSSLANVPFEPVQRLASISVADLTVASRLFLWDALSREALAHPLLGYGAEHVNVPFNTVYDPSRIVEEWFDRSHNAYLDYLIQFGIGGLLLYLALVVLFMRAAWRLWREQNPYGLPLLLAVSVYAMQNFFVFDTGMTLWLLFALTAAAVVLSRDQTDEPAGTLFLPRPFSAALVGAALACLVFPIVIQPSRANVLSFESYQYQIVDVPRSNAAAQEALSLGTYADIELGYNAYFMYTEEQLKRLSGDDLVAAYDNAIALLTHSFVRYPSDARTALYLAQVLVSAPPGVTVDKELLSSAIERTLRLSPKRYQAWYILANLSLSDANAHPAGSNARREGYAAAKDLLERYTTLVPELSIPHFVLAQINYALGDKAAAAAEAEKGKQYYVSNLETASRAAIYYENTFDLPNAKFFLTEIVRLDPLNTAAADDLKQIEMYER